MGIRFIIDDKPESKPLLVSLQLDECGWVDLCINGSPVCSLTTDGKLRLYHLTPEDESAGLIAGKDNDYNHIAITHF
jgi:hypothetical protein